MQLDYPTMRSFTQTVQRNYILPEKGQVFLRSVLNDKPTTTEAFTERMQKLLDSHCWLKPTTEVEARLATEKKPNTQQITLQDKRVLYWRVFHFNDDLVERVDAVRKDADKYNGAIIDLASCPGGTQSSLHYFLSLFMDGPSYQQGIEGYFEPVNIPKADPQMTAPLTLICNKYSASAAAIFASVIQHRKRSHDVIIGDPTHPKNTVQSVYVEGGFQMSLTTKEWRTPYGSNIQRQKPKRSGVIPHFTAKQATGQQNKKSPSFMKKALERVLKAKDAQVRLRRQLRYIVSPVGGRVELR